jgi:hypothetical protein
MSSTVATIWIGLLFVAAIVWLVLISWVFRRLRRIHPAAYEAIGSPSLLWNNSMRNNWLFFNFLFRSRWRSLGDSRLSVAARGMQALLIVYVVGFVAFLVRFMTTGLLPA